MQLTDTEITNTKPRFFVEGTKWYGRASQRDFCFQTAIRLHEFALLEKTSKHGDASFEVVRIRTRKKDSYIGDKLVFREGDEYLPRDEEWGRHGWTYNDWDAALCKLNELVEER